MTKDFYPKSRVAQMMRILADYRYSLLTRPEGKEKKGERRNEKGKRNEKIRGEKTEGWKGLQSDGVMWCVRNCYIIITN